MPHSKKSSGKSLHFGLKKGTTTHASHVSVKLMATLPKGDTILRLGRAGWSITFPKRTSIVNAQTVIFVLREIGQHIETLLSLHMGLKRYKIWSRTIGDHVKTSLSRKK